MSTPQYATAQLLDVRMALGELEPCSYPQIYNFRVKGLEFLGAKTGKSRSVFKMGERR